MAQHVWKCGTMCRTCLLFHDYIFHCFRCILYIIMMSRACLTCALETAQLFCMIMVSFNRLACVNVVTGNSDIIYFRMRNPVFLVWFIVFPIADNIETRNVMVFFWFVKHSRLKYTVRLMEPQRCYIQCRTGLYVLQPLAKHSRWTIYFSHKISCKQ